MIKMMELRTTKSVELKSPVAMTIRGHMRHKDKKTGAPYFIPPGVVTEPMRRTNIIKIKPGPSCD